MIGIELPWLPTQEPVACDDEQGSLTGKRALATPKARKKCRHNLGGGERERGGRERKKEKEKEIEWTVNKSRY